MPELLVLRDLALGHLRLRARLGDVRDVGEGRQVGAQRLEDQELGERVGEVLLGPDDVGDLHRDVVDDAGEVVQRRAVGPDDHEVADLVGRLNSTSPLIRSWRTSVRPGGTWNRSANGRPSASNWAASASVSGLRRKR